MGKWFRSYFIYNQNFILLKTNTQQPKNFL